MRIAGKINFAIDYVKAITGTKENPQIYICLRLFDEHWRLNLYFC